MAAEYLHGCDCRSYLHVGFAGSTGSSLRGEFFRKALAEHRCSAIHFAASCQLLGTSYDEAALSREAELTHLLTTLPKPLGVWALSDIYAAAICAVCQRLGMRIPEQVRVLGTNDTALARTNAPTLSSIRTPGEHIGYLAAKTLHRLLDGKRASGVEVPAEELVIRESTAIPNSVRGTIDDALTYIQRHACSNITVDQIAQKLGMSRRTFFAQFQQQVGHSPSEEIQRVRLATAKELLEHEELSITRVAALIGFAETAAFSKFFTKHVGVSPREYRERQTRKRRS
jgi:LacI family transcriptional regulator